MKKIIERAKKPTPKFWKKVQKVGIVAGIVGGALLTFPVTAAIGTIVVTVGGTITALSQLTVQDEPIYIQESKKTTKK
jgi:putative N-acetylmannosamine-6-phosphate epimerase